MPTLNVYPSSFARASWRRRIVRGQYGHSLPSTVMSQANRARPGLNGTGVYDRISGIAIMSGDAGDCPIGPAANPANPRPSPTNPSQFDIGTSFADGFAFMSTNWAKKNSIPSFSACFLTDSVVGIAMAGTPCPGVGPPTLARTQADFHRNRGPSPMLRE